MAEELSLPEAIGWILHKHDLSEEGLAALLNVHPVTVEKWLSGRELDLNCAATLLDLIQQVPDRILPLLAFRADHPEGDGASWPLKIAQARVSTGLRKTAFADLIGAQANTMRRWEEGSKVPGSCSAVLIDLLYAHPREMVDLLGSVEEEPPAPRAPWTRKRLLALLASQGMTTHELAELLDILPSSLNSWLTGHAEPGSCQAFFLSLLERFPEKTRKLLAVPTDGEWPPERLREARGRVTTDDLGVLTGIHPHTFIHWETGHLPSKFNCPTQLYAAMERYPRMLLEMADELAE